MIEYNSMIAEFNKDAILKVIVNRDDPGAVTIITLDENGEEVDNTFEPGFPMMEAMLVNNSSYPVTQEYGTMETHGMCIHKIIVQPDDTAVVDGLLGTNDGETYVYLISGYDDTEVQYAVTDTVGCMLYGGFIIITDTDPESVRKCTITYTDL